mmetsp:Transcript_228/g.306  ORF Transcript_228/g.306 Transcript_228/m.306 type:complete len:352 (-) Transcript_228:117-1172(-)
MPTRPIIMKGHTRPITQVLYNHDGDLIFSCSKDKVVTCWRSDSGERLGTYEQHRGAVNAIDVDRLTTTVASAASDSYVKLWEAQTGEKKGVFKVESSARAVNFALGDKLLLAAQDKQMGKQPAVFIYTIGKDEVTDGDYNEDGSLRSSFDDEANPMKYTAKLVHEEKSKINIVSAKWCDMNKTIVTAHEDGMVRKWDVETQKILKEVRACETHINSMSFSRDQTMLIAASQADQCGKLIDAKTLKVLKTYKSNRPINAAAISPTYNQVLIGGGIQARDVALVDSRMSHFEVDFWHICYQFYMGSARGHFGPVNSIDIHPNGKSFVSGGEEGEIRLHHMDSVYVKSSNQMEL